MKSIELSSSLTKTGSSAFSNCKQLVSVDFNGCTGVDFGNQTFLGSDALESVAVPANSTLGSSMFSGCSALRAVTLGEGIAEIPGNCFADCVSLESIAIPDSVTETGSNSFSGCTSLTQLTFGENSALTVLRGVSGTGLASLTIPASVTEINGCTSNYYLIEIVNRSAIELVSGSSGKRQHRTICRKYRQRRPRERLCDDGRVHPLPRRQRRGRRLVCGWL